MTSDEFARLVHRAEELAKTNPAGYRFRLVALGGLGYAFVWSLLLVAVGLILFVVLSAVGIGPVRIPLGTLDNLLLPIGAFVVVLGQALWVPLAPPQGRVLEKRDFPRLFEMIERVRREVDGPPTHEVLLDDQFNASISQIPRLGVFGWYQNYLTLGLPLLSNLSPEEFEAVVAHEYGHLAGSHGRLGVWIYRIRATWGRLLEALHQKKGVATGLVRGFFEWYAPFFNAYSFAMAWANEYEADRIAASVSGPDAIGSALVGISTLAPFVHEDFWAGVMGEADRAPSPTTAPFTEMAQPGFGPNAERARELLDGALAAQSDIVDTHPSLSERLGAIGIETPARIPPERSAAEEYLGEQLPALTAGMVEQWRHHVAPYFEGRHQQVAMGRARLDELGEVEDGDAARLREKARLLDELEGREVALPLYRRLLDVAPDDPLALCVVGFEELRAGDDTGIERVEKGMSLDDSMVTSGCQALRDHLAAAGRMEEANRYHERLVERHEFEQSREEERVRIRFAKVYEPHGLAADALAPIVAVVAEHPRLSSAYLVRKQDLDPPIYILAVTPRASLTLTDRGATRARELADALNVPQDILTVVMTGDNKQLRKFVKKVQGARIR